MTDAQTRSYIDDCVKQDQAKLTDSQARLSADITLLRTDVQTMIDTSLNTQNERMQGFIRDAIAANTKPMTASATAPFATKKEMMTLFADFKQDLRNMIPAVPTMMPMQHRPPQRPGYQYHHYPPNYPVQLQHPASPHDTPVGSPASKKAFARAPDTHARQPPDESEYDVHAMELARHEYTQYATRPPMQHYAHPHHDEGASV
jgi:hypothetical protein